MSEPSEKARALVGVLRSTSFRAGNLTDKDVAKANAVWDQRDAAEADLLVYIAALEAVAKAASPFAHDQSDAGLCLANALSELAALDGGEGKP